MPTLRELEQQVEMLRDALVVAYTTIDHSEDATGDVFSALSVIRHSLEETGGFQRAMHPDSTTESSDHSCQLPDITLREEGESWTCPKCGRHWVPTLDWDHSYYEDGREWKPEGTD